MSALMRGELSKTLTTRTLYAFLIGGLAFSLLNAVIVGAASGTLDDVGEKEEAFTVLPVLLLAWGLVGAAGEYRHRTAAPSALVARRGRGTLLAVRLAAYAVTALVLSAVMIAGGLALGMPLIADMPGPPLTGGMLAGVVAGNLAGAVLAALIGAAVGALVRNQVVGVVVLLVLNFAVLPLVAGASESLANLTPFGAMAVLSRMTHNTTIGVPAAGLVLAGWAVAASLLAVVAEGRRDLA
jgi:hypothetical protein